MPGVGDPLLYRSGGAVMPVPPPVAKKVPSGVVVNPKTGEQTPYNPTPYETTNQYQTGPSTDPAIKGIQTAVSGIGTLAQPAYEQQQQSQLDEQLAERQLKTKADLSSAAFKERLAAVSGPGGPAAPAPEVGFDANGNEAAARAAIFARAKDSAGANARASLDALRSVMSESGMLGSGYEAAGTSQIINGAQGQLGEVNREQDVNELDHALSAATTKYQGGIAQRGQDLGQKRSLLSLINASGLY